MAADAPGPSAMRCATLHGVSALPRDAWDACFPGEPEGWSYYRACEAGALPAMGLGAAAVFDAEGLLAAVPTFRVSYRLDTPFQGRLRRLTEGLPLALRVLVAGSPYAERCHLALRPGLAPEQRDAALAALAAELETAAGDGGCLLAAWKDVGPSDAALLRPLLLARGHAEVTSLPLAVLDLDGVADEDAYLARLSKGTRRDIRRKLRSRARFRIEHRTDIADVADRVAGLYESTKTASEVRYGEMEELPRGYFPAVAAALGDRARVVLYWIGEELAGFNLLLLGPDRVTDKFLGMAYPLGPENDLYAVSWMENLRLALSTGCRYLQSGQTAYGEKLRLGSGLIPSALFARPRFAPLRPMLRAAAPLLAFDRHDPVLRAQRTAA